MELNRLVFPAPSPTYAEDDLDGLVWLPLPVEKPRPKGSLLEFVCLRTREHSSPRNKPAETRKIPAVYLRYNEGSSKILLYFHGNAEDIGFSAPFLNILRMELKMHVIAPEYPGYGLYQGSPNAEDISRDALAVYDYLTNEVKWRESDIILFGRSIGSGPATYIAARRNPGALVLMSPYTSIKGVVNDLFGTVGSFLIQERFNNLEEMRFVICPTLLVHGRMDELISYRHSEDLMEQCRGVCHLAIRDGMTHNIFNLFEDLIAPIEIFFTKTGITTKTTAKGGFPKIFQTGQNNEERRKKILAQRLWSRDQHECVNSPTM
eukprot:TRINITY_DN8078_c0_g1_i1.p1 TRINITY_DN8078_c0_g1~~TRINITY_DN8078_c0_g1_i1.p1  ORF type:complete len:320 (-),score=35.52 TRINITY_DN8078_c0_g1_i1:78-1037(-)